MTIQPALSHSALRFAALCAVVFSSGVGCDDEPSAGADTEDEVFQASLPAVPGRQVIHVEQYTSIDGESGGSSMEPPTICELGYSFDGGAGVYTVEAIIGVTETWQDANGPQEGPALWVFFQRTGVTSAGAEERLALRFNAGPYGDGRFLEPSVHFEVGEQVLLLYTGPKDRLQGFPTTAEHGVFSVSSSGQPVGAFGTFEVSVDEFLALLEVAEDAVGPYRPTDISQAPSFGDNWEEVCPPSTLLSPTTGESESTDEAPAEPIIEIDNRDNTDAG
jgi:hypothetical protein